jgi:hypothetical protein
MQVDQSGFPVLVIASLKHRLPVEPPGVRLADQNTLIDKIVDGLPALIDIDLITAF